MGSDFALRDPRLPPELERKVFKIAGLARPTGIPALMPVARRVKGWVEPLLYRVVLLADASMNELHNLALPIVTVDALEKRPHTCLQHVRSLFINGKLVGENKLENWLLACTGVTNLYAQFLCTPKILPSLSGFTNIRYLTIDFRALCGPTVPLPLFLTVTHLELLDFTNECKGKSADRLCQNLSFIPCLTHIAFNMYLDTLASHAAVCAMAQLQCIVFLSIWESFDGSPLLDDSRFVCIKDDSELGYYSDWLYGVVFGEDYWTFAEAFLAARRAGTIDRMCSKAL
ncbi:hypothetical protein MSAN_00870700 [Mycena sanguinolenta]|uniref:Uncharacterized protein n=1 Tax=Mycena sanguinolenta TaxID=230812 RepID=A0A8H6YX48_9AGAR|nr:hypothetical protein MSAN_00870700 [Mycena sanguinolenta]